MMLFRHEWNCNFCLLNHSFCSRGRKSSVWPLSLFRIPFVPLALCARVVLASHHFYSTKITECRKFCLGEVWVPFRVDAGLLFHCDVARIAIRIIHVLSYHRYRGPALYCIFSIQTGGKRSRRKGTKNSENVEILLEVCDGNHQPSTSIFSFFVFSN